MNISNDKSSIPTQLFAPYHFGNQSSTPRRPSNDFPMFTASPRRPSSSHSTTSTSPPSSKSARRFLGFGSPSSATAKAATIATMSVAPNAAASSSQIWSGRNSSAPVLDGIAQPDVRAAGDGPLRRSSNAKEDTNKVVGDSGESGLVATARVMPRLVPQPQQQNQQRLSTAYLLDKELPRLPERPLPPIVTGDASPVQEDLPNASQLRLMSSSPLMPATTSTPPVITHEVDLSNSAGPSNVSPRLLPSHLTITPSSPTVPPSPLQSHLPSSFARPNPSTSLRPNSTITFALPALSDGERSVSGSLNDPSPTSSSVVTEHRSQLRRARSFLSPPGDRPTASSDTEAAGKATPKRRLSIGPGLFGALNATATDTKGKGKEKDDGSQNVTPEGKTVTRKSSFWTRRRMRVDSSPSTTQSPTPSPQYPPFPYASGQSNPAINGAAMSRETLPSAHTRQRSHSFTSPRLSNAPSLPALNPSSPLIFESFGIGGSLVTEREQEHPPRKTTRRLLPRRLSRDRPDERRGSIDSQRRLRLKAGCSSDVTLTYTTSPPADLPASPSSPFFSSFAERPSTSSSRKTAKGGPYPEEPDSPRGRSWEAFRDSVTIHEGRPTTFSSPAVGGSGSASVTPKFDSMPSSTSRSPSLKGYVTFRRRSSSLRATAVAAAGYASNASSSAEVQTVMAPGQDRQVNGEVGLYTPIWSSSSASTPTTSEAPPSFSSPSQSATVTRTPSTASNSSSKASRTNRFSGRRRSNTTVLGIGNKSQPPLLRRLSQHFFSSTHLPTSASPSSPPVPLPRHDSVAMLSSSSISSPGTTCQRTSAAGRNSSLDRGSATTTATPNASACSTLGPNAIPPSGLNGIRPKPRMAEGETPDGYLKRLIETVSKAELATILASSNDSFHSSALRVLLSRFDFTSDPLDVALRKLLMDLSLPKETQQIDRVMEAFAKQYEECNPGLFISDDHPYILAFSLMMLHTDAFNRSNKRKMTKQDYIRNTRLTGVPTEVLDCFYDNIVFAPFIFVEDPLDFNGQRGLIPEGTPVLSGIAGASPAATPLGSSGSGLFGPAKIDPYFLITQRLLIPLRGEVEKEVPQANPFLYTGTAGAWNERKLQSAFAEAESMKMTSPANRRRATPLTVFGSPEVLPSDADDEVLLKVTKFGVLGRKEDLLEGGRRSANRKWKEWSVLLTGSQMLFFRDPALADQVYFQQPSVQEEKPSASAATSVTRSIPAQPDEILSVKDAIALYDTTYTKYFHTFRFVMPNGRQFLMHAPSEYAMNEWIALINYASAFKTAGVRMRPPSMTDDQAQSAGNAAAMSYINDLRRRKRQSSFSVLQEKRASSYVQPTHASTSTSDLPRPRPTVGGSLRGSSSDADRTMFSSSGTLLTSSGSETLPGLLGLMDRRRRSTFSMELESPSSEPSDGRLEDTFFEVKAELAGKFSPDHGGSLPHRSATAVPGYANGPSPRAVSLGNLPPHEGERKPISPDVPTLVGPRSLHRGSRSIILAAKLKDLEGKITSAQSSLDADLRVARNFAVLSPFQRSTRDRLVQAIPPLARKIRTMRMTLAKLVCHRDVLYADMAAEDGEWRTTLKIAVDAGTEYLTKKQREALEPLSGLLAPEMTVSDYSGTATSAPERQFRGEDTRPLLKESPSTGLLVPGGSPKNQDQLPKEASTYDLAPSPGSAAPTTASARNSTSSSFLRADADISGAGSMDSIPMSKEDTRRSGDSRSSGGLSPPKLEGPGRRSSDEIASSPSLPGSSQQAPLRGTPTDSPPAGSSRRPSAEQEQCEDWNKTRAAKRVSLALLPSDRKLSALSLLGRYSIKSMTEEIDGDERGVGTSRTLT